MEGQVLVGVTASPAAAQRSQRPFGDAHGQVLEEKTRLWRQVRAYAQRVRATKSCCLRDGMQITPQNLLVARMGSFDGE